MHYLVLFSSCPIGWDHPREAVHRASLDVVLNGMSEDEQTKFHNFICQMFRLPALSSEFGKDMKLYSLTMAAMASFLMHFNKAVEVGGVEHHFIKAFLNCAVKDFKYTLIQIKSWSEAISKEFLQKNSLRGTVFFY